MWARALQEKVRVYRRSLDPCDLERYLCGAPTKASRPPGGPPPHGLGALWFGGWLFTIGFLKLVWWKALVGLVIWPYFVGAYFAR